MSFLSFKKNPNTPLSDNDLVKQYQGTGDFKYIQILFDRYTPYIYGVVIKYIHEIPLTKDLILEIYASLPDKIGKSDISNFKGWIYRVTKNHVLNYFRKQKRRSEKENDLKIMQYDLVEHPIDEEDIFQKKANALDYCLEKLKADQKRCISLFYYENYSYAEIVEETGFLLGKIRSLIQNGRRNLKICINNYNG